jgi:hypothetical protein
MSSFLSSVLFGVFFTFIPTLGLAQGDNTPSADRIKSLYERGKFEDILLLLKKMPEENFRYYYNLGTIYYLLRKPGQGVAYLEKANRIKPHEPDVQNNLALAKTALAQAIGPENVDPSSNWVEHLADGVSLDEARAILGFLGLCVVLLWIRAYFSERSLRQALFNPAGSIGVFCFLITVGVYFAQRRAASMPPTICLEADMIRSGPGDSFLQLSEGVVGSKYRFMSSAQATGEKQEEWRQVRYSTHEVGWMRASSLLLL